MKILLWGLDKKWRARYNRALEALDTAPSCLTLHTTISKSYKAKRCIPLELRTHSEIDKKGRVECFHVLDFDDSHVSLATSRTMT